LLLPGRRRWILAARSQSAAAGFHIHDLLMICCHVVMRGLSLRGLNLLTGRERRQNRKHSKRYEFEPIRPSHPMSHAAYQSRAQPALP
jgi:hypothetical protein